ncbi:cbb3-type cytochrome c oxidase subunit I [Dinghuibacter silviterrae]|uniref:cbb3-type cytochrome c oxidase subunit I n=1 Tax=Dinghuibacter silviterrae TaxID=1539049 RepID=UPI0010640301|nr:cbb3-type cytochrome c oxidase subunit I [Dinghuibacter silviterrae]
MKTLRLIAACLLLLGLPPVLVMWQHVIVWGLNPFVNALLALVFLLLAIPPATWLFKTLKSPAIGKYVIRPDTWFALGAVVLLVLSFDPGRVSRYNALDIHLHDTYFMLSQGSVDLALAAWFALMAFLYFIFPRITKRPLQNGLGYIHFWITVLVGDFILFPARYMLQEPLSSRYMDYAQWNSFRRFDLIDITALIILLLCLLAQLLLPVNMILAFVRSRKREKEPTS